MSQNKVRTQYLKQAKQWIKTQQLTITVDEIIISNMKKEIALKTKLLKMEIAEVKLKKQTLKDFQTQLKKYVTE